MGWDGNAGLGGVAVFSPQTLLHSIMRRNDRMQGNKQRCEGDRMGIDRSSDRVIEGGDYRERAVQSEESDITAVAGKESK